MTQPGRALDSMFELSRHGTTVGIELRAGVVTFLTMAYILVVNPSVLGAAGMPAADVLAATAISAAVATLLMGLLANYPFALAPGMGLNAFFAFTVVGVMGVSWQRALAAVTIAGLLFVLLSLGGLRRLLVASVPTSLKIATMAGIGLFLSFIGLQGMGLVVDHPATLVTLGDLAAPAVLLGLGGVVLMAALLVRRVRGALLWGIGAVAAAAWLLDVAPPPAALLAAPRWPAATAFHLDFGGIWTPPMLAVIASFLFVDLFDTAGTLLGVGRLGGFTDERGDLPRSDRAFLADAVGTTVGGLLGTSPVTSYVESATGVEEGGRTGLTAVVVALLFLLALPFAPLLTAVPAVATAPALVVVGALMMQGARDLEWQRLEEAVPALLTVVAMPFTYSIAHGVSLGVVSWVVVRVLAGRAREVPPLLAVLALVLVGYHVWVA